MNFKDFHYQYVPNSSSWEPYFVGKPDSTKRQQLPMDVLIALENGQADEALEILKMQRKTSKLNGPLTWIISQKGREAIQSIFDPLMLLQQFFHQKRFHRHEKMILPIAEQVLELTRQLNEQMRRGAQPMNLQQRLWKMLADSAPFTSTDIQKISIPDLKNLGVMQRFLGMTSYVAAESLSGVYSGLRTLVSLPFHGIQKMFQMTQSIIEYPSRLLELALAQGAKLWSLNPMHEGYAQFSNRTEAFIERNLERITEKYESWKEYVKEHWEKMAEMVNERWEPAQRHLEERVKDLREFTERHVERVKNVAQSAVQKVEVIAGAIVLPLTSFFQQLQETTANVVRRGREGKKKKSSQFATWAKKCSKPLLKIGKWSLEIVQKEALIACQYVLKLLHFFERILKKLWSKLAVYCLGVIKVLYFLFYGSFVAIKSIPKFIVRSIIAIPRLIFRLTLQPFIDAIEK